MPEKRIALVVNTEQYRYHKEVSELFRETICSFYPSIMIELFDMAKTQVLHEMYFALRDYDPQQLISFDCAGFTLRTENDTLSYNLFGCRMAHILFQEMERYRGELRQQMNFSMFVYSMRERDVDAISARYPNIPNASLMERLEYKDLNEKTREKNREIIAGWYRMFEREAQLTE